MAGLIAKRREKSGFSTSQLASLAGVDPGQTSRILDGQFRTISGNVLRICNALGFDPHTEARAGSGNQAKKNAAWAKLEASVRRAWDETSLDADRLVAVIDAVAKIKPRKRGKEFNVDTSSVRNPLR
ncbi:helix-turn-helix domain-containing protein [Mesorhizobium sp. M0579]|uniref:helix-turn-helix domain-containing protein n=1 Tax=Mesorhizobium sp. M0579 TaxID=2956962 RepID=UPI00333CFFC0